MATEQPADFHSMSEYTEVLNAMAAAVESSTAQRDNLREYIGIVEAENAQLHAEIARLKQFIQTNTLGSCTGAASMPVENHGPIESHCSVDTNFESECLDHCEGKDAEHADTATIHVQTHQPNMDLGARRTESKPQRSAGTPHQHSRRGIVDPNESPKPLTLSSLDPPMSHRSNISASKPRRSTQKRSEFSASTDRAETYMVRRLAAQMRQRAVTVDKLYYSMDRFRTDSASFGEFSEGLQMCGIRFSLEDQAMLFDDIDRLNNHRISWKQLKTRLEPLLKTNARTKNNHNVSSNRVHFKRSVQRSSRYRLSHSDSSEYGSPSRDQ